MKIMFLVKLMLGAFLVANTQGLCAGEQTGKITEIRVNSNNLHLFFMDGMVSNRPTCHEASKPNRWAIKDENSAGGKSQFSMVLAAYMAGKNVKVDGANTCSRWSSI